MWFLSLGKSLNFLKWNFSSKLVYLEQWFFKSGGDGRKAGFLAGLMYSDIIFNSSIKSVVMVKVTLPWESEDFTRKSSRSTSQVLRLEMRANGKDNTGQVDEANVQLEQLHWLDYEVREMQKGTRGHS